MQFAVKQYEVSLYIWRLRISYLIAFISDRQDEQINYNSISLRAPSPVPRFHDLPRPLQSPE